MKNILCLLVILALFSFTLARPKDDSESGKTDSRQQLQGEAEDAAKKAPGNAATQAEKANEKQGGDGIVGLMSMIEKPIEKLPGQMIKVASDMAEQGSGMVRNIFGGFGGF